MKELDDSIFKVFQDLLAYDCVLWDVCSVALDIIYSSICAQNIYIFNIVSSAKIVMKDMVSTMLVKMEMYFSIHFFSALPLMTYKVVSCTLLSVRSQMEKASHYKQAWKPTVFDYVMCGFRGIRIKWLEFQKMEV